MLARSSSSKVTTISFDSAPASDADLIYNKLVGLKNTIELMDKVHQVAILKLLKQHNDVVINSNKSGLRINLSELPSDIIDELEKYVEYVENQQHTLDAVEKRKEDYRSAYFADSV